MKHTSTACLKAMPGVRTKTGWLLALSLALAPLGDAQPSRAAQAQSPATPAAGDKVTAVNTASSTSPPAPKASNSKPKPVDPLDWPNWRGPQQNSTSAEKGLVEKWNPKDPKQTRQRSDLGTRSTPIVMRGKLYVLVRDKPGTADEGEKVVCVDAATLKQIWEHRLDVYLTDVPDTRVGWSALVGDPTTGRLYAQGVGGLFCCLEGDSGKLVWQHNLSEEYGTITTYGGRTNFPIMFDDTVLISAILVGWGDTPEFDGLARPSHRFLAFDKATGELRWLASTTISPPDTNYSTPVAKVVGGEAQLIIGGADGKVWSFQPRTGKSLWSFPLSRRSINASPLVVGTTVYCGHSEENLIGSTQGSVVAIDATMRGDLSGKEKWQAYTLMAGKSSPVMVGDKLWVVSDMAKLQIIDPNTGKVVGRKGLGTMMRSTPVYADGKVYACTATGIWYVLKPKGDTAEIVQRLRLGSDQNDGSPIVSHGRIYLPTSEALYCIGSPEAVPQADPPPQEEQEPPVSPTDSPATLVLSPYDALLKPKETKKFVARLYNAKGQLLREAKPEEVTFRVEGPGKAANDGTYTAPNREGHVGALVFCKVGALEGKARVRIVPALPWTFDFNKGDDLPITWIGGRVRYVIEEIEGERAAKKRDVLPTPKDPHNKLGTRSQLFMGPSDLTNYTIQGDFRLNEKQRRMPDCGLINSGYSLVIRSGDNRLMLYSWGSHDHRTAAQAPLEAQVGAWYRLKLQVTQLEETAEVKGKLWLRDQAEPAEWTLQMVDNAPVRSGSPGVFGRTQEAEFYMDNLSVTPNK